LQNISDSESSKTVMGTAGNAVNANLPGFSTNSIDGFTTYTDGTNSLAIDDNVIQNVLTWEVRCCAQTALQRQGNVL